MIVATPKEVAHTWQEDTLAYLPHKPIAEYRRNQIIYDEQHPSNGLSLVIDGRIKVTTTIEDGSQTVTGIFTRDHFFGEMALLGSNTSHREQAAAMEKSSLMSWTRDEIETQIERQPRLGLALMQILVERCLDLQDRLQSLALDKTPERVGQSLIRFARLGTRMPDGAVTIPPLTHNVFSEYIGTSREIVTMQMNQFRKQGFVRYSRKAIEVYPEALDKHLKNQRA